MLQEFLNTLRESGVKSLTLCLYPVHQEVYSTTSEAPNTEVDSSDKEPLADVFGKWGEKNAEETRDDVEDTSEAVSEPIKEEVKEETKEEVKKEVKEEIKEPRKIEKIDSPFDALVEAVEEDDGEEVDFSPYFDAMTLSELLRVNTSFALNIDTDQPLEELRRAIADCFSI